MRYYFNDGNCAYEVDQALRDAMTLEEGVAAAVQVAAKYGHEVTDDIRELLIGDYKFTDRFWSEKAANKVTSYGILVIVGAEAYSLHTDESIMVSGSFRGFGGALFKIRMHDGREYVTNNLWGNGTIPKRFRNVLSPNAVFVQ